MDATSSNRRAPRAPTVAVQDVPPEIIARAKMLFGLTNRELAQALEDPWNLLVILDICEQEK
jgi:hypothetical protein